MKVLILCGGAGTRMFPENNDEANEVQFIEVPKPMITIGNKPILWRIMKLYSKYGVKEFVLLVGMKNEFIKYYFNNPEHVEPNWKISYSYAGDDATKGDRIRRAVMDKMTDDDDDDILLAYGDDLCNVNIKKVIDFHKESGKLVTLTSVKMVSNFGILKLNGDNTVSYFEEKPELDHWINGGYIVMKKKVLDMMLSKKGDETDIFKELAKEGQVQVYKHEGFWKSMNTIKDMIELREMWKKGELQKQLGINE